MNVLKISILLATFLKCVGTGAIVKENLVKTLDDKVPKNILPVERTTSPTNPFDTNKETGTRNYGQTSHLNLSNIDPYNCDREA